MMMEAHDEQQALLIQRRNDDDNHNNVILNTSNFTDADDCSLATVSLQATSDRSVFSKTNNHNRHEEKRILQRFYMESVQALDQVFINSDNNNNDQQQCATELFRVLDLRMAVLDDCAFSGCVDHDVVSTDQSERLVIDGIQILLQAFEEAHSRHMIRVTPMAPPPRCADGHHNFKMGCHLANDMIRIADRLEEEWVPQLLDRYPHLEWNDKKTTKLFLQKSKSIATQIRKDATVVAQEKIPRCVIQSIQQKAHSSSVSAARLFSLEWEEQCGNNKVMKTLVQRLEMFMHQAKNTLPTNVLYCSFLEALTKATVGYYLQELAYKASHGDNTRRNSHKFRNPARALVCLRNDIQLLQACFKDTAAKAVAAENNNQDLHRTVVNELNILDIVYEFLSLAWNRKEDFSFVEDFILILHQKLGANVDVTNLFVTDMWMLMVPHERRQIQHQVKLMMEELNMVSECMKEQQEILDYEQEQLRQLQQEQQNQQPMSAALVPKKTTNGTTMPLSLDGMLKALYEDRIWQERLTACSLLCITSTMM